MAKKKNNRANKPFYEKKTTANGKKAVTFASLLRPLISSPVKPVAKVTLQSAPLAHLNYSEELKIKTKALKLFWKHFKLPGAPESVIASPRPRHYRTTSKRRAVYRGSTLQLLFGENKNTPQKKKFVESPLEPIKHSQIYSFLQKKLSEPPFKLAAMHLNYLIVRGNYSEQSVIFNVDTINGPLVRKLKIIAGHLQKLDKSIASAFIYPDPSCSDYYLEANQPDNIVQLKKLFGKGQLSVSHHDCRFLFHPTSFSQVNESIVPVMLDTAREMLAPTSQENLLDLYCGYGLFSQYLAKEYKQITGIDGEGPSIRSAMSNKKLNSDAGKIRYKAMRITENSIEETLPNPILQETILLDPPRKGPDDGVIAALCKRTPKKILHIHCGVNQIPDSMAQWNNGGYTIEQVVPLDMFPGSANLEVLILLSPIK